MIISHKHKYIFFRAPKSASTSLTAALQRYCGPYDIQTGIALPFDPKSDEDAYSCPTKNCKNLSFRHHDAPSDVRKRVTRSLWRDYFKFTVVRNPWDFAISRIFHETKIRGEELSDDLAPLRHDISERVHCWNPKILNNQRFFFNRNGSLACDYYIRFEHLQMDFNRVSRLLSVPEMKLIKTKDRFRNRRFSCADLLTPNARQRIFELNKKTIRTFGYKF